MCDCLTMNDLILFVYTVLIFAIILLKIHIETVKSVDKEIERKRSVNKILIPGGEALKYPPMYIVNFKKR